MGKLILNKTIEARKLNPRTGVPTSEAPVTIPFGAIIQKLSEDRDVINFKYLEEPYQCRGEILEAAIGLAKPVGRGAEAPAVSLESRNPEAAIQWQPIKSSLQPVLRAKVPGGWLVLVAGGNGGLTFYPDPEHRWDGCSLP